MSGPTTSDSELNGSVLRVLCGLPVWRARRDAAPYLAMEFGQPHLAIREPIVASADASERVRRGLARRRIHVVGDWHFWVQYAPWSLSTPAARVACGDDPASIDEALAELDGQIVTSVTMEEDEACVLFDLGASLRVRRVGAAEGEQWSLHASEGGMFACMASGQTVWLP